MNSSGLETRRCTRVARHRWERCESARIETSLSLSLSLSFSLPFCLSVLRNLRHMLGEITGRTRIEIAREIRSRLHKAT
jgi:hypothetical protein